MMILLLLLGAGCGPAPRQDSTKVRVVATLGVLADWANQVGGERVTVTTLLRGNESPHTFEPGPAAVEALARADVLLQIGLGLEEWLDPVVENAGNRRLRVVTAADVVDDVIADDEHGHGGNPHIWLDPEYAKRLVKRLANVLAATDPPGESLYRQRAQNYARRLDSLSAAILARAGQVKNRRFISFHDAWPYFCRRFRYEVVATVEPKPGQEPSARELASLTRLIRETGVRVVTTEPQLPTALPLTLAAETGVRVIVLNPLLTDSTGRVDYISGLGQAAEALAQALGAEKKP